MTAMRQIFAHSSLPLGCITLSFVEAQTNGRSRNRVSPPPRGGLTAARHPQETSTTFFAGTTPFCRAALTQVAHGCICSRFSLPAAFFSARTVLRWRISATGLGIGLGLRIFRNVSLLEYNDCAAFPAQPVLQGRRNLLRMPQAPCWRWVCAGFQIGCQARQRTSEERHSFG